MLDESGWTGRSSIPGVGAGRPGNLERGVFLHVRVGPDDGPFAASLLIRGLADLLGVPGDTHIIVATMDKGVSPSRSLPLSTVTEESLSRLCDEGDPFFIGALGATKVDFQSSKLPDGDWSVSGTVSTPHELGEAHRLDEVVDLLDGLPENIQILSGGVDIQQVFDRQASIVFPLNRSNQAWGDIIAREVIGGYYWMTIVGEPARSKLGEPPDGLRLLEREQFLVAQFAEDPENDAEIRKWIPTARAWLRPVLSGWMAIYDPGFDARLYEGPVLPQGPHRLLERFANGDLSTPPDLAEVLKVEHPLDKMNSFVVRITDPAPAYVQLAQDALFGTASAFERGIADDWIDIEPLTDLRVDGLVIEARGPSETLRLLLHLLVNLSRFREATADGPVFPIAIDQVAVKTGT